MRLAPVYDTRHVSDQSWRNVIELIGSLTGKRQGKEAVDSYLNGHHSLSRIRSSA